MHELMFKQENICCKATETFHIFRLFPEILIQFSKTFVHTEKDQQTIYSRTRVIHLISIS